MKLTQTIKTYLHSSHSLPRFLLLGLPNALLLVILLQLLLLHAHGLLLLTFALFLSHSILRSAEGDEALHREACEQER